MKIVLSAILCALLCGCLLGERGPAAKTFSLLVTPQPNTDQPNTNSTGGLKPDSSEVQDALNLVYEVLKPLGYERVDVNEPNSIATFIQGYKTDQQSPCKVNVCLRSDRIDIHVGGGGGVNQPFSKRGKEIYSALKNAFIKQYGKAMVVDAKF